MPIGGLKYRAADVADWFLSKINSNSGDTISPLKLQKLIYYAQAWHLTAFNTPIFGEDIEAWAHGPVVPSQYHRFKHIFRDQTIDIKQIELKVPQFEEHTEELLYEVLDAYGEHSAGYLERLTHKERPWIEARGDLKPHERCSEPISHKTMIEYYSSL